MPHRIQKWLLKCNVLDLRGLLQFHGQVVFLLASQSCICYESLFHTWRGKLTTSHLIGPLSFILVLSMWLLMYSGSLPFS
jgi:hypothetical protein